MLWKDCKEKIVSDSFLREQCTTFIITINNTVSDAIRRQDATTEIVRGQ